MSADFPGAPASPAAAPPVLEVVAGPVPATLRGRGHRRAVTIRATATRAEREQTRRDIHNELVLAGEVDRPVTRGDCDRVPRPCPFVTCRWSLFTDTKPNGSLVLNSPEVEPSQIEPAESCALDVAERGGCTLDEVGQVMGVTRERVRQIEEKALRKIGPAMRALMADGSEDSAPRRLPMVDDGPASLDELGPCLDLEGES